MARIAETVAEAAPGFYLIESDHGFVVHINASAERLRLVRDLADKRLTAAGVDTETAEGAQLVASELIGNAVRSCGDLVPLVVEVDAATGQLVVWKTFGNPPQQTMRRKAIPSLEALAAEVAIHRHEAFLQHNLAQTLASAAVQHLGADPGRLEAAVKALSDPTSTTPVSQILRRGTVPPQQTG